ncbi:doenitin-1-like [Dermacentor variabilis]|uniref:doenitin-1-like n=1 Tax=Dermacentor variabilis TaxID=34621 RepID=UPI003F5B3316
MNVPINVFGFIFCVASGHAQTRRPRICNLPPETGPCKARILAQYYNPLKDSCEEFTYGGCGGNENRFDTRQLCEATCLPKKGKPNPCEQPPEPGNCRARIPKWFFDVRSRNCKIFTYGGCGGNENNFDSEEICQATCLPTFRRRIVCSQDPQRRRCLWGPRWFFNSTVETCQRLPRDQCATSANRFPSCVQCMGRCTNYKARESCRAIFRAIPGPGQPE